MSSFSFSNLDNFASTYKEEIIQGSVTIEVSTSYDDLEVYGTMPNGCRLAVSLTLETPRANPITLTVKDQKTSEETEITGTNSSFSFTSPYVNEDTDIHYWLDNPDMSSLVSGHISEPASYTVRLQFLNTTKARDFLNSHGQSDFVSNYTPTTTYGNSGSTYSGSSSSGSLSGSSGYSTGTTSVEYGDGELILHEAFSNTIEIYLLEHSNITIQAFDTIGFHLIDGDQFLLPSNLQNYSDPNDDEITHSDDFYVNSFSNYQALSPGNWFILRIGIPPGVKKAQVVFDLGNTNTDNIYFKGFGSHEKNNTTIFNMSFSHTDMNNGSGWSRLDSVDFTYWLQKNEESSYGDFVTGYVLIYNANTSSSMSVSSVKAYHFIVDYPAYEYWLATAVGGDAGKEFIHKSTYHLPSQSQQTTLFTNTDVDRDAVSETVTFSITSGLTGLTLAQNEFDVFPILSIPGVTFATVSFKHSGSKLYSRTEIQDSSNSLNLTEIENRSVYESRNFTDGSDEVHTVTIRYPDYSAVNVAFISLTNRADEDSITLSEINVEFTVEDVALYYDFIEESPFPISINTGYRDYAENILSKVTEDVLTGTAEVVADYADVYSQNMNSLDFRNYQPVDVNKYSSVIGLLKPVFETGAMSRYLVPDGFSPEGAPGTRGTRGSSKEKGAYVDPYGQTSSFDLTNTAIDLISALGADTIVSHVFNNYTAAEWNSMLAPYLPTGVLGSELSSLYASMEASDQMTISWFILSLRYLTSHVLVAVTNASGSYRDQYIALGAWLASTGESATGINYSEDPSGVVQFLIDNDSVPTSLRTAMVDADGGGK